MAASQRLLAVAIFGLLVAALVAVVVKGPSDEPRAIAPGPTQSSPEPTETFTFPGLPPSETPLFPTESETAAGPEVSPSDELPRTGAGSLLWPALMALGLAVVAGVVIQRSARRAER
ncbi:MAG: hypothetical protein ACRDKS_10175 [Actinomycetota bacterium]